MLKCKFCHKPITTKRLQGYCQPCYRYFILEKQKVYPKPKYGQMFFTEQGNCICPICGKAFPKLGNHLAFGHHIPAKIAFQRFGWDLTPHATSSNYQQRMRACLQEKCVTENLIEKGKNTRFTPGSKGRTREQMSEMTKKRLQEQGKNANFRRKKSP